MKKTVDIRIVIACICAIVLLGGILIWVLLKKEPPGEDAGNVSAMVIDPDAKDWDVPENTSGGVTEGIEVPGYGDLTFTPGQKTQQLEVGNPSSNNCYFIISITVDNEREIYRSGLLKPGSGLTELTLSAPLEPGEYRAEMRYECYTLDEDKSPLNNTVVDFTIHVPKED